MGTEERASTGFARRPSGCQPGSKRLLDHLVRVFGVGNSGCFSPYSTLSSGSPSWHAYGKAVDLGVNWNDPQRRAVGDAVFAWLMARREELNAQQFIWGDDIWDISYGLRGYRWHDHKNHVHAAIGYKASQLWTPSGTAADPGPPPPPREDAMDRYIVKGSTRPEMVITADFVNARLMTHPDEVTHYVLTGLVPWERVITWPQQWVDPLIARARAEAT